MQRVRSAFTIRGVEVVAVGDDREKQVAHPR
jgi:hypothetical protein